MNTLAAVGLPERRYDVQLIEKNRQHWYSVTDRKTGENSVLPGVTGVLGIINKPPLLNWVKKEALKCVEAALLKRMDGKVTLTAEWVSEIMAEASARPDKIKDQAADYGTQAHQVFDRIVLGEKITADDVPEPIRPSVLSFLDWLEKSGIRIVMGDTKVACLADGFGGSLDALGWKDDHYVILDWKTSKGIYDEYALQVAAYATAFEETFGVPVGEAHIIRFGKEKPDWEHKSVSNLTISYAAFIHAKQLQSLMKEQSHFDD